MAAVHEDEQGSDCTEANALLRLGPNTVRLQGKGASTVGGSLLSLLTNVSHCAC